MNMLANSKHPEVALALCQADAMTKLLSLGPRPLLAECLQRLDCPKDMLDPPAQAWVVKRIHLGNEFCERLLPTPSELSLLQQQAQQLELDFCLVTPMLTDAGFKRLDSLLPLLSEDTEVVINDWGALQQVRADYPSLVPVLGRMLNKMIKDPRLPSEQWTQLHPHNSQSAHFRTLLERFGIKHLEMDVPPFARIEHFNSAPMALSVHFPYGYTVKGRMCRIGSLGQRDEAKFVAAHACNKECLNYWAKAERCGTKADAELDSFQRGNTQFYRHSAAMATAMWQAVDKRWIDRVIVAGDWHENHRTTE